MPKVISINRTPGDYIRATRHLTLEERGAYQDILDQIVELGQDEDPPSLPDDDRSIAGILGCTVARWRQIKRRLCTGALAVLICEGGRLSQTRIVEEIEAARTRIAGSSKAGVASGESRRKKRDALRERLANGRSTPVEHALNADMNGLRTDGERRPERNVNGSRTSHESRVTSHEKEPSLQATPSVPEWPLGGVDALDFLQKVCETIAPHLTPPDDFTVSAWLRDLYANPYIPASVICEAQGWLIAEARTTRAFDSLIRRRHAEGWQPEGDPKGFVEFRLMRAPAILADLTKAKVPA